MNENEMSGLLQPLENEEELDLLLDKYDIDYQRMKLFMERKLHIMLKTTKVVVTLLLCISVKMRKQRSIITYQVLIMNQTHVWYSIQVL